MKTFKEFQEGIFDFLPKGKFEKKPGGVGIVDKDKKYRMPIQKQPTGGSKMPVLPGKFPKSDKYKVTEV
tara:strand:- start:207 stop:413 length:207 start_codon:yes stop_codon:yes gene_type:complete